MKNILMLLLLSCTSGFANVYRDSVPLPQYNFNAAYFDDCDACGCSANGGSMGFSSMLNANFVGVRYIHQSYKSRDGIFNNSPWIDENFNTAQVWARIPVAAKVQVLALLPYHFNNREKQTGTQSVDGIGDVTLMGFYTFFETMSDSAVVWQKLQLGAGIKAPTGKYDSENNGSVNPSFQLGTGSWDYSVAGEYIIRKNNLGFNAIANYTFKTENDKNYRFGNQLNYGGTFFYNVAAGRYNLVPQAGLAGEVYAANKDYNEDVPLTKGNILFSKLGFEAGTDKLSVGVNAMLPLSQDLVGGRVEANYRWSVNINYVL